MLTSIKYTYNIMRWKIRHIYQTSNHKRAEKIGHYVNTESILYSYTAIILNSSFYLGILACSTFLILLD